MEPVRTRLVGSRRPAAGRLEGLHRGRAHRPAARPAERCTGLPICTPEGTTSAHLTLTDRARLTDASLDGGSARENAAAYRSMRTPAT
ncbi:hypothetical protein ACFVT2_07375 [Streptomyces sp. NPDC058000]|uniref:hypothetical protein n=1 Tax=Streptomyces sp. NPDC058000 TaxID=3346299 RepID=UPI0036ED39F6